MKNKEYYLPGQNEKEKKAKTQFFVVGKTVC